MQEYFYSAGLSKGAFHPNSSSSLQSDVFLKACKGKLICPCETSSYDFGQNAKKAEKGLKNTKNCNFPSNFGSD